MTYADYLLKRKRFAEDRKTDPTPPAVTNSEPEPPPVPPRTTSALRIRSESAPAIDLLSQAVGVNARSLPAPPRQQRSTSPSRGVVLQKSLALSTAWEAKVGPSSQRMALLDASFSHEVSNEVPQWQPPPAFLLLEGKETSFGGRMGGPAFGSPSRSLSPGPIASGGGSPVLLMR